MKSKTSIRKIAANATKHFRNPVLKSKWYWKIVSVLESEAGYPPDGEKK